MGSEMCIRDSYRWKDAQTQLNLGEHFAWQESGELKLESVTVDPPGEPGHDHAEGITKWSHDELVVVYDAPSKQRFAEPATVSIDKIAAP